MYKIIILGVMLMFSFAKDSSANSPWDPRLGEGMPESAKDDQFSPDQAEESREINPDQTKEDGE